MKISRINEYLVENNVPNVEKLNPEQKLNLFLENLSRERNNYNYDALHHDPMDDAYQPKPKGYFRSELLGASSIIYVLDDLIKNPSKMLENLADAFSRRGFCIFPGASKEAFKTLIKMELNKGNDLNWLLKHKNEYIASIALGEMPEEIISTDLGRYLNDKRTPVWSKALERTMQSPKLRQKYAEVINANPKFQKEIEEISRKNKLNKLNQQQKTRKKTANKLIIKKTGEIDVKELYETFKSETSETQQSLRKKVFEAI